MDKVIYTYREVARRLDVRSETVSDLVKKLGIPNAKHPANGRGRALDEDGFRQVREALTAAAS